MSIRSMIRVRAKKEGLDTFAVEAKVCVLWPYGGRSSRPLVSDAKPSDCVSNFCEVTTSTKRLSSHSKGAGLDTSAFALSPIRAVFLDGSRRVSNRQ